MLLPTGPLRNVTLTGLLLTVLTAAPARAQTNPGIPFLPKGFANPDEFWDRMFGNLDADTERALQKIEVSYKNEVAFGQPQVEAFLAYLQQQELRVVRKGKEVDYLKQLVETIRPSMQNAKRYQKLTINLVDSPRVDARSFPGGTLFFFKGLLSFADSEAALVGIVGHELSHLDRGHLLWPLKRTRMLQQTFDNAAGGFDPQQFFAAGATMTRMLSRPFRPQDEAEADRDGAAWAYRTGYDPREMAALFDRLHQRSNDPKLPFAAFFRTHPYSDDRASALLKQYDELQQTDPRDPLYRGIKNLAQRIPKSQQTFPE